jgi:hypothetical protein
MDRPRARAILGATMSATVTNTTRELHTRESNGIHVRLLWCERDGRVSVAVNDARTGEAFAIEVRDGESAMDVFHHPFAYAAWRRVDTAAISRRAA